MTGLALLAHLQAHLSSQWHLGFGPRGWWAWTETARGWSGFGRLGRHAAWSVWSWREGNRAGGAR